MPIYEYSCKKCDQRFEKLVKSMHSDEPITCPKCGSKQTARSLSVFAVGAESAKGSGSEMPTCDRCGGLPGSCGMN